MILQKYFAALLSVTIVVLTAFLAIPTGQIDGAAIVQLVSIGVAAIVTYWVPLVNIKWRGILKTGAAIVAAMISIAYPIYVAHGVPNSTQIAMMVLAGLNALGVELGVQIRIDSAAVTPAVAANTEAVHELTGAVKQIAVAPSLTTNSVPVVETPTVADTPVIQPPAADTVWVDTSTEKPDPGIPELQPVVVTPNPANAADDTPAVHTTSVNVANLVAE